MAEAAKRLEAVDGKAGDAPPKDMTIPLIKPIQAHGETMKEITFRRPTGEDLMAMGADYPIVIDWQTGRVSPNPASMGNMMSRLAAVPPSSIRMMDARDFATCAHALMSFFQPDVQAMTS